MTNTGDFRRYSYSGDASYALKAFDVSRSSAAPVYKPERKRNLKVRENGGNKSRSELVAEQRAATVKIAVIVATALVAIAMLFAVIGSMAAKNELNHEITNLENRLSVAQSENTRINSELNAMVSMSMIDQYAVEELGMVKIQSNQIKYIDVAKYKDERQAAALRLLEDAE